MRFLKVRNLKHRHEVGELRIITAQDACESCLSAGTLINALQKQLQGLKLHKDVIQERF